MPFGEAAFDALARGAIDGMEISVGTIVVFELFRRQRYLSLTGHIFAPAIVAMSRAAHDRLSEADRRAFVEAVRLAAQNNRRDVDDLEAAGLARLLSVGMWINDDVDKAAFRAAPAPAYTRWREQFGDLIDRIQLYH